MKILTLSAIEFPDSSEVLVRSSDGSLSFADSNITLGTVNFFNNVKHLSIKDDGLISPSFNISKGIGSFQTDRHAIMIRAKAE